MVNKNDIIYRGGVDTIVSNQHIDKWTMAKIRKLVNIWGYKEGTYRLWMNILEIDEDFFQIRKDDDAYNFAAYACATPVNRDICVEHDVKDIELEAGVLKCVNGVIDIKIIYDKVVEGLDDSEDDRVIAPVDGFDGVDVTYQSWGHSYRITR